MEFLKGAPDGSREQLQSVREKLLALHKALLDSERTAYEIVHGKLASPAAFLQLLISDPRFAWLRPITTLIVQIDETLAAKNPPSEPKAFTQLLTDTRALFSPSREEDGFWKHYVGSVERDPGVAVHHQELVKRLG